MTIRDLTSMASTLRLDRGVLLGAYSPPVEINSWMVEESLVIVINVVGYAPTTFMTRGAS